MGDTGRGAPDSPTPGGGPLVVGQAKGQVTLGSGGSGGNSGGGSGGTPDDDPGRELRRRLVETARERGVAEETVEQDYAAGYLLAAVARSQRLGQTMVLKGGGALKKLLFEDDYRFSEDLDFSAVEREPAGEALFEELREVGRATEDSLGTRTQGFEVSVERYVEKRPHPEGQEAFVFRFKFPWHRRPTRPLKIEVTQRELVVLDPVERPLFHSYGAGKPGSETSPAEQEPEGPAGTPVRSYAVEEMVSEKLLALVGSRDHLRQRGWTNGRSARDLYDLDRLLARYGSEIDREKVSRLLRQKAARRSEVDPVEPQAPEAAHVPSQPIHERFLADDLLEDTRRQWDRRLGPVVPGQLPSPQDVVSRVLTFARQLE